MPNAHAALAQLVEQRTENPCVPGSIPGGGTKLPRDRELLSGWSLRLTVRTGDSQSLNSGSIPLGTISG